MKREWSGEGEAEGAEENRSICWCNCWTSVDYQMTRV
jgi:hypothetical protein